MGPRARLKILNKKKNLFSLSGFDASSIVWTPTHSTTRVTTYTCYMYCCRNTGIDLQDFKFSVFKLFSNFNEVQTYSLMMIC